MPHVITIHATRDNYSSKLDDNLIIDFHYDEIKGRTFKTVCEYEDKKRVR